MSCYEWSHGTIVLPSNQFAMVKKAVADAQTSMFQQEFDEAQAFWKSLTRKQQTDREAYLAALRAYRVAEADFTALWKVEAVAGYRGQEKDPRRLIRTDWEWPTNRTTEFHDDNLDLIFDTQQRSVTYVVPENNHAREWAERSPLHTALMEALRQVRWSRSSGGVILGNDEYNRDSGYDHEGAGGSYVVMAFGPEGAREAPSHVTSFRDANGALMMPETSFSRSGRVNVKFVPYQSPYRYR